MANILVVDDEPDLCELLRINLVLDGHRVSVARDGVAALDAARAEPPDLVVLDVMMPGRDGFSVLAEMKSTPVTASVPVVMLTARAEAMDRLRGGIEGAVRYVTKPFSVADFRVAVAEVLAGDEPAARRRAQTDALAELARLEAGRSLRDPVAPGPRLTRLEPAGGSAPAERILPGGLEACRARLTSRQAEVLETVLAAADLRSAAEALGVSRSYLYASLRRMARKLGARSGPALLVALRADSERVGGSAHREGAPGRGLEPGPAPRRP